MDDNVKELIQYRLQSARERLEVSALLLDAGKYKDSISKSY